MENMYAVILAGGGGERFWPFSTPERPKQFLDVFGGGSLLRRTFLRILPCVPPERTFVITGADFAAATRAELPELPPENIVGEPCRRDTAAACALACALVAKKGGRDAVAAVLPADHLVADEPAFRRTLADAAAAASRTDAIVTIGIAPEAPSTGFGYIQRGGDAGLGLGTPVARALRFAEKPDLASAKAYLASGEYLWNAGLFVWRAETLAREFAKRPALAALAAAVEAAPEGGLEGTLAAMYPGLERISFDYAIMEHAPSVLVCRGDFGWDDVGTWEALRRHMPADADGNVAVGGGVTLLGCRNVSAAARTPLPVAVLGAENLIVAVTEAGVLVAAQDRAQDLKAILKKMSGA